MTIKESKSYQLIFSEEDARLIDTLIRERVGNRKISEIMDDMNYVQDWYCGMFSLARKSRRIGVPATLNYDEENVLKGLISWAYNDGKHKEYKELLEGMSNALKATRY